MILVYRGVRCAACGGIHVLYNPDPLAHAPTDVYGYECPGTGLAVVLRPPASFGIDTDPPPRAVPLRWLAPGRP